MAHTVLGQSYYKATVLQSSGGTSAALGINDSGMVAGSCPLAGGSQPCIWSPSGVAQGLGNLGGTNGAAYAINNLGEVAGSSTTAGNMQILAFFWTASEGMQNLGSLGSGFENEALAMNDSREVVGVSCLDSLDQVCHAFLWSKSGGMKDLGTLGGNFSEATGINAAGHIAGWSTLSGDDTGRAFFWTAETGMQQIEPSNNFPSYAWAVNDSDQVVGEFNDPQDNNEFHGFLWTQANGLQDLGTLGSGWSEALGINASGDVVGFARAGNADKTGYAVMWKNRGTIEELATLVKPKDPVLLPLAATGINSTGQIAANGNKPVYLLTPRTQTKLTSSLNPSGEGSPVTFTAVVSSYLNPPPNGATVTFKKGATVLGTGTLSGGSASFTTSTLKVGTTTVTAVYGGANFVGSTSEAVKQVVNVVPQLISIAVAPVNAAIGVGKTVQYSAYGTYSDGSSQNLTSSVTWSSANVKIATIASGGLATGVKAGTTTIMATIGAVTGGSSLTVN